MIVALDCELMHILLYLKRMSGSGYSTRESEKKSVIEVIHLVPSWSFQLNYRVIGSRMIALVTANSMLNAKEVDRNTISEFICRAITGDSISSTALSRN